MNDDWLRDLEWNGIAYAAVTGCALLGLIAVWLKSPMLRRRWLPLPRIRPGTWTGLDVFLAFCVIQGFPALIIAMLLSLGFFDPLVGLMPDKDAPVLQRNLYFQRCLPISSPLIVTLTLGFLFAMMFARSGSRPHQYGMSWGRWYANVGLGILAFVCAWPVILGIYALVSPAFSQGPHPFKQLAAQNLPVWEWGLLGFQAIVMAPLMEEILYRGILLAWLRRASLIGQLAIPCMTFVLVSADLVAMDGEAFTFSFNGDKVIPVLITLIGVAAHGYVLFRFARDFRLSEAEVYRWRPEGGPDAPGEVGEIGPSRSRRWADANALLAIVGTAMLFAVMHPRWPDPIALFPMGLLLGWLAHRTQSLVGPIVFHALFNLTAFIALYGSVLTAPPQNGNAETTALRPSVVGSTTSSTPASQLPLRK